MSTRPAHRMFLVMVLAGALLGMPASAQRGGDQNSRPDTPGTSPYPAMKEEIPALPRHVVYRPANVPAMGAQKLGVVAEQKPFPRTETSDLTKAIDWALAENTRQGSPYFGRIDPTQVAVSGFSCGGLQAALVANDPRVKTLIMQNTGTYDGERPTMPGLKVPKSTVKTFHTPVLYILGGPTDVAYGNGMEDFKLIDHVPVAVANLPVGHGGTYSEPNGGAVAQVAVAWLNWQLRGDAKAATRFVGERCGLCTDATWTFERKNLPSR